MPGSGTWVIATGDGKGTQMNSILMVVVAVIVILLVFVMFSLDDQEEYTVDENPARPESEDAGAMNAASAAAGQAGGAPNEPPGVSREAGVDVPPQAVSAAARQRRFKAEQAGDARSLADIDSVQVGSEEDLRYRLLLDDQVPPPTEVSVKQGVAVIVQIRLPEELQTDQETWAQTLASVEAILSPEKAPFPYSVYLTSQFDHLWLFGIDEERDDPVFEAIVCAFDAVRRFKKALESQPALQAARARLSVGISSGKIARIKRGPLGPVSHAGKAVYTAEALSEVAGDFMIYVDDDVHRLAIPLFDFREWKPIKLRPALPPIPFYEVMGWNKKEEMFAFASHKESYARRAVAVAFRYLEFDDMGPLINLMNDADEKVVLETLATLAEIGDPRGMGMLKKILPEARDPMVRSGILKAFGGIGSSEVIPLLKASMKDAHWLVRYQAVLSMARLGGSDALKHIEELASDDDGAVRAAVHQVKYLETQNKADLDALNELLGDLSGRARKAAAEALIKIGTREALSMVARSFHQQEPGLCRHILRLLMECRSQSLYQTFLTLFQHSGEKLRPEIVAAVRRARLVG